jgi:hypothetical protein
MRFPPDPHPQSSAFSLARQLSLMQEIIKEATEKRDPVASRIRQLKLESNHIVMLLTDPYAHLGKLHIPSSSDLDWEQV